MKLRRGLCPGFQRCPLAKKAHTDLSLPSPGVPLEMGVFLLPPISRGSSLPPPHDLYNFFKLAGDVMTHQARVTSSAEDHRSEWNLERAKGCGLTSVWPLPSPPVTGVLSGAHRRLQSEQLLATSMVTRAMTWHRKFLSFTKCRCLECLSKS